MMRQSLMLAVFVAVTGCSNHPIPGMLDYFYPSRADANARGGRGGVCGPNSSLPSGLSSTIPYTGSPGMYSAAPGNDPNDSNRIPPLNTNPSGGYAVPPANNPTLPGTLLPPPNSPFLGGN